VGLRLSAWCSWCRASNLSCSASWGSISGAPTMKAGGDRATSSRPATASSVERRMSAVEPIPPMASPRRWVLPLFFCLVAFAVFLEQTWPYWHQGELLAGIHADGPFHFYNEAARLSPEYFPKDLAVQSNRDLGFYEYFYGSLNWLVNLTGASLLKTNLAVCWVGNFLYLGGVMVLLWRLKLSAWTCALGTLLAAQPFVLTGGMSSGVIHSLAIPREVWLWPMPWLVGWFIFGKRAKARLLIFYGLLGAVYGFT